MLTDKQYELARAIREAILAPSHKQDEADDLVVELSKGVTPREYMICYRVANQWMEDMSYGR